jgi:hypothetical protein
MMDAMLTTTDNPYDPFTQFVEWQGFDEEQGYNTCAYLARVTPFSSDLSEQEQATAMDTAIDEIVALNVLGIYKKVLKAPEKASE